MHELKHSTTFDEACTLHYKHMSHGQLTYILEELSYITGKFKDHITVVDDLHSSFIVAS